MDSYQQVRQDLVSRKNVTICHDLNKTPVVPVDANEIIYISYLLKEGEDIVKFPNNFGQEYPKYSDYIVAYQESTKLCYIWNYSEKENRENNCQRVRNGMNNSIFEDYDFYRVRKLFTPPNVIFGNVSAINQSLIRPIMCFDK